MVRLIIAAVIILFPLSLARVDQRGAAFSTLVLQLERTSPAFAAFEDLQNDYSVDEEKIEIASVHETLSTGEIFIPSVDEKNFDQEFETSPTPVLALKPLKIKMEKDPLESVPKWESSEELPSLQNRKQMIASELSAEIFRQPSAGEKAKELVQRELSLKPQKIEAREIPTSTGGMIIVKKEGGNFPPINSSPYAAYQTQPSRGKSPNSHFPSDQHQGGILVSGPVRLRDGVGDLGIHSNWRIYREVNGRMVERGSINIRQAEFAIHVGEKTGFVVAELSDHFGRVLGRGRASLDSNDPALFVNPVASATVAAYSPTLVESTSAPTPMAAYYKPFGGTRIEASSGEALEMSHYTPNSRFLMETSSRDHYPTLMFGALSSLSRIPLYTQKAVRAFRSIVKSFYKAVDLEYSGLVWGKVTKEGQSVEGASIEVAQDQGKIVYFNEIGIPRSDLVGTTSYGQFAVTNLPEGVQSVRVIHEGHVYPAQIFPSVRGKLTQLSLEIPTRFLNQSFNSVSFRTFKETVPSTLRVIGYENDYDLNGPTDISFPEMKEGLWVELDAGAGYEIMRAHLPQLASRVEVNFPVIPSEWMANQMIHASGKVLNGELGVAVGFAGDSDVEVSFPDLPEEFQQIVFFDKDRKLFAGTFAPAGGGYVIFNLPLGFQTVELRELHSTQSFVESFVSEADFLALIGSQGFIKPLGQEDSEALR